MLLPHPVHLQIKEIPILEVNFSCLKYQPTGFMPRQNIVLSWLINWHLQLLNYMEMETWENCFNSVFQLSNSWKRGSFEMPGSGGCSKWTGKESYLSPQKVILASYYAKIYFTSWHLQGLCRGIPLSDWLYRDLKAKDFMSPKQE